MNIRTLLYSGLLLIAGSLHAQTDFRPGYVILLTGDTLHGEIDYRGDYVMGTTCRFKMNHEEKNFTPDDIASFRFTDSKYFVSREVKGKKSFLEFLIDGQVNIFYLRELHGESYFIEKEGMGLVKIPYEEEIRNDGNKQYLYKSTRHLGLLKHYMMDAPGLQSRIDNIGKPDHKNLISLAEDYHNTVCKDTSCIIYEKKMPALKVEIEITGGMLSISDYDVFVGKRYLNGGLIAHFWMPNASEKLYFRTGILYSYVKMVDYYAGVPDPFNPPLIRDNLFKFPIQLEYIYPRGIIMPKAAFGINLYKPFFQSVAFMGGLNVKLHRHASFSLNYDIDFEPTENMPVIPRKLFSQAFLAGILLKF